MAPKKSAKKAAKTANADNTRTTRRSLSIFSRKGRDLPSPVALLASSTLEILPIPKPSIDAVIEEDTAETTQPGRPVSVLRSPKTTRQLQRDEIFTSISEIEKEMATSPNEEILKSIGASSALAFERPASMYPIMSAASTSVTSLSREGSLKRRGSGGGVQKRTSAAVAATKKNRHSMPATMYIQEIAALVPEKPVSTDVASNSSRSPRPKIQVVIPHGPPKRLPPPVPFLPSEAVELPAISIVSKPYHARSASEVVSPPTESAQLSAGYVVSAVELDATTTQIKLHRTQSVKRASSPVMSRVQSIKREVSPPMGGTPPGELKSYLQVPIPPQDLSHDGSSNDSISGDEETHSAPRSHRSSITSIDSQPEQLAALEKNEEKHGQDEPLEYDIAERSQSTPVLPGLGDLIHLVRTPSIQRKERQIHKRSLSSGSVFIPRTLPEAVNEDEERSTAPKKESPTLSEAERNLEHHLHSLSPTTGSIIESWLEEEIVRTFSIKRKPMLPPKSERRISRASSTRTVTSITASPVVPSDEFFQALAATVQEQPLRNCAIRRSDSVRSVLSLIAESEYSEDGDDQLPITSNEAERVIYMILERAQDLSDFFSLARINMGFYRVAKRHELELMLSALRNMSPAAWEFRQESESWEDDDSACLDYTMFDASKWYKDYIRDSDIIGNIKLLILEKCQSILRPDTVRTLVSGHKPGRASNVDDALWRIWTFCKVFGGDKERECDIKSQMDWLRGGVEAHKSAIAFLNSEDDSELVNGPELMLRSEHFGLGNRDDGLTAEELYDVTEMWNCVRAISQGVIGRTEQARQYGVFDDTDVRGGDIDGEEIMLGKFAHPPSFEQFLTLTEEWHSHVLTKGLDVAYELSKAATPLYAFSISRRNNWTKWTPPNGSSRRRFILEAASRLYEEKISETFNSQPRETVDGERCSVRRRRRESMAEELKLQKKNMLEKAAKGKSSESMSSANEPEEKIVVWEEKMMSRANSVLDYLSNHSASSSISSTPALPQLEDFEKHAVLQVPASPYMTRDSPVSPMTPTYRPGDMPIPSILVHTPSRPAPPPPVPKKIPHSISTSPPRLSHTPTPSLDSPSMPITPPPPQILSSPISPTSPRYPKAEDILPATFAAYATFHQNRPLSGMSFQSLPSSPPTPPPRPLPMTFSSPHASAQHPFQYAMMESSNTASESSAMLSSDRAVFRIVEMGFTAEEAKGALKITDMGDGLRIDRAIEFLLRQQG
jgi:hypothetical protein